MATLKQLRQSSKNIKTQLTRFETYLKNLDDKSEHAEVVINQVQCRLDSIEPLWRSFDATQTLIENAQPDDKEDEDSDHRADFEAKYFECVAKAKFLISEFQRRKFAQNQQQVTQLQRLETNRNSLNVKLPTINLPVFNGFYDQWMEFYDTFNSLIHNDSSLNDTQKFHYLRSSLKGDALHLISSIEISASNYAVAWQILRERYENKKIIINKHVKALFSLTPIKQESHIALRRLLDDVSKHIRALEVLGQPVKHWGTLIIYILTTKFDPITRREWETFDSNQEMATFETIKTFLQRRCEILEALVPNAQNTQYNKSINKFNNKQIQQSTFHVTSKYPCVICKNPHSIFNCEAFLKLPINGRISEAKKLKLCINCLRTNHLTENCKAKLCRICNKPHNTLLHIDTEPKINLPSTSTSESPAQFQQVSLTSQNLNKPDQVLLPTANIYIADSKGRLHICRALLDSGSQANFITEDLCNRLSLRRSNLDSVIYGINGNATNIIHKTDVELHSIQNSYRTNLSCLVIPSISDKIPLFSFDILNLNIPENLCLADTNFNQARTVDLLIGSSTFWDLLCVGQVKVGNNKLTMQKTKLGWIVAGPLFPSQSSNSSLNYFITETHDSLETQVSKFWMLEECGTPIKRSREEQEVEDHFIATTKRDDNGRFIVSIPKRSNIINLGDSRHVALKRFYNLEKKLSNNQQLREEYIKFMTEYEELKHMSEICEDTNQHQISYYLPHHPVVKETSLTTKVRVVFDGSCKSSTSLSLNDIQKIGPIVQDDLFTIILRFRQHVYVIIADIAKMYRQVLIDEEDRRLHRIFWRADPSKELKCFELNTVTYGTASAAFLSTRCLKKLSTDHKEEYPMASSVIEHDFYVDDLISGSDSISETKQIYKEVSQILLSAGFALRKWMSNQPDIFDCNAASSYDPHQFNKENSVKTLGITWIPKEDILKYAVGDNHQSSITKRTILSLTAQIFDPLGLVGPITVVAKLIIQRLWQYKLSWDESIPLDLNTRWLQFRDQLPELNSLMIPRHVLQRNYKTVELHGFSDSSENAYGACIYIRSIDETGNITSNLLCAKSRVAPLKSTTLPRLELCAAVLLAHLARKVRDSLTIKFEKYLYWSDSTIALCWIKGSSSKWKTFVGNRVADIQSLTSTDDWHHINTKENPADLLSRGTTTHELCNSKLWWHGPAWLSLDSSNWPAPLKITVDENIPEKRKDAITFTVQFKSFDMFTKYSSLTKLQRVLAYILRFINNTKMPRNERTIGNLTVTELDQSLLRCVKIAQHETFLNEIQCIKNETALPRKSKLLCLNPFLDASDILRVGGRLHQSKFAYDKKHPFILPSKHPLTTMIVRREHLKLLHCGPQLLLASLRERFWIPNGRNVVRQIYHKCIPCFKAKPRDTNFIMGSLPEPRVVTSYPFETTGIDYAGPILIKDKRSRGYKLVKSYIALFICFSTKAMHLEVVTDLTSENFIAALRRFVARRGKPSSIYSDNGTNFVGANAALSEFNKFVTSDKISSHISNTLSNEGISWSFIPPKSPHFGGLWEAGVKSIKHHLYRVVGNAHLTYEEVSTVLTQIEAVLNSRPLCPLTTDPTDLTPLTPAHFLVGRTLTSAPDPNVLHIPENRLNIYQRMQSIIQHFWKRWSNEYVPNLQVRCKWQSTYQNLLQPGAMVLLKEDNLPPLRWKLGRVTELHPGPDGVVRVISVQCTNGLFKRAVTKVCVLPLDS